MLPSDLKEIGREAFVSCFIKTIYFPDNLELIGESAFAKCKFLESVSIPTSVKRIEKWAFHGCPRLNKVVFRHDPEFLGDWLFNRGNTVVYCRKIQK